MIIDDNMHWLPPDLFSNEDLRDRFIASVPREYGEHAFLTKVPGTDTDQIVVEWPEGCHNLNYVDGEHDMEEILADMDEAGVDKAILRLPVWQQWLPIDVCKIVNDGIAETCAQSGGRLVGTAAVPPWGAKADLYEFERCIKDLGFVGAQMTCHYGTLYLDHEAFKPFFKVLNDEKIPAVVHHTPMPVDFGHLYDYHNMRRMFGRAVDQGTAVAREIFSGMFEEFPNLKLVHTFLGGAWFAFYNITTPRKSPTTESVERFDENPLDIPKYLKENIYFDIAHALPWGKPQLECAIKVCGAGNVLWGSSYPVRRDWLINGIDPILELDITQEEKDLVLGGTAQKLFGL